MAICHGTSFMTFLRCILFIFLLPMVHVSSKPSYNSHSEDLSRCDLALTNSNGKIQSPNYPHTYPANKECSWTIILPRFQRIVLVFETFNLQPASSSEIYSIGCERDHIAVYDGANFVGKYCAGNIPPRQITTKGHTLRVVFKSGNRTTQRFLSKFSALYAACGGYFTGAEGNISSPGYPYAFAANIQCQWKVRVPTDYVIQLIFNDFNMGRKYPCNIDYVRVLDGLNSSDTVIGQFCSTRLPQKSIIWSTGNTLSLEFKSHRESNSKGFQVHYSRKPHCNGLMKSDYGRFKSPGYPVSRKMDNQCKWLLSVSEGKIVSLMFDSFDVDSESSTFSTPGDCKDDYVEVFDGFEDKDNLLGRFCTINNKPISMVRSTGRSMLVRLKTSSRNKGKGFLASYYGLSPDNYFGNCDVFDNKLLFRCNSGRRIPCQLQCDGTYDCPDASDERHCKHISTASSQKTTGIQNYVIVILSATGSILSIICIFFIVDKVKSKRTTSTRRRRRISRPGRSHLRMHAAINNALTEEPSSPPPPYDISGSSNPGDIFEVAFSHTNLPGICPSISSTWASERQTHETQITRNNQTQNQTLVPMNQEDTSNITVQEVTTQNILQGTQTSNTEEETGTISPSESINCVNDTTQLIRSDSVIAL